MAVRNASSAGTVFAGSRFPSISPQITMRFRIKPALTAPLAVANDAADGRQRLFRFHPLAPLPRPALFCEMECRCRYSVPGKSQFRFAFRQEPRPSRPRRAAPTAEQWLTAPMEHDDGMKAERTRGTPQGGVVSPILANLFLHYTFDLWMTRMHPDLPWCRYADDGLVHCRNEQEALALKAELQARLAECRLEMHPTKTKIVYCKRHSAVCQTQRHFAQPRRRQARVHPSSPAPLSVARCRLIGLPRSTYYDATTTPCCHLYRSKSMWAGG